MHAHEYRLLGASCYIYGQFSRTDAFCVSQIKKLKLLTQMTILLQDNFDSKF